MTRVVWNPNLCLANSILQRTVQYGEAEVPGPPETEWNLHFSNEICNICTNQGWVLVAENELGRRHSWFPHSNRQVWHCLGQWAGSTDATHILSERVPSQFRQATCDNNNSAGTLSTPTSMGSCKFTIGRCGCRSIPLHEWIRISLDHVLSSESNVSQHVWLLKSKLCLYASTCLSYRLTRLLCLSLSYIADNSRPSEVSRWTRGKGECASGPFDLQS